ncbi:MAG TPA: AAA family ATPase [Stellaceae bacterium]|nr:AAA family ATPase [Stellaceae bacterium]
MQLENFKAFEHFTVSLERINILVGPNNSGKSTIIGAFRALDSAIKVARSRPPTRVFFGTGSEIGYRIPEASLPMSLENVHTNYNSEESTVTFRLNNGNRLRLIFPEDGGCVLIPHAQDGLVTTTAHFKSRFPINLTVVPVLGPVEHREARRERDTVVAGLSTHRASRHFRSYWHYFADGFSEFAELIRTTWPGMEIELPELNRSTGELLMFCREGRITRELYWVGFGFQIWCQLLTHLSRAKGSALIIVDEPEVYLHPDVQRQLLGIVRDIDTPAFMATHSSEIMSEADPDEIVLVDKRRRSGERLKDISGVQKALDVVGSAQNITLTALARSRRVLFVEGDNDFRVLRRFARRLGMRELGAGVDITALESGGFGSWERVTILASGIADVLGSPLIIAAIYDRDYFCQEYIDEVLRRLSEQLKLAHVHQRKEIENYLLAPAALDRAIAQATSERGSGDRSPSPALDAAALLREITDPLRDSIQSQVLARRWEHLRSGGKDLADVNKETMIRFAPVWDSLPRRLEIIPGKQVLSQFREQIQQTYGISLTDNRIIEAMRREDIPDDLMELLHKLEDFRKIAQP